MAEYSNSKLINQSLSMNKSVSEQQQLQSQQQTSIKFKQLQQQLQQQIKKNRNLLQTNFTLMEQNEQYITGFTKLKNCINYSEHSCEESVMAEQIEELVNTIMEKLNQSQYNSESLSKQADINGNYEGSKWKELYIKQSQQSYRLSQYSNKLNQHINRLQQKIKTDHQEFRYIMDEYLGMFKRINSVEFIKSESMITEIKVQVNDKQRKKSKENNRNNSNSAPKKKNNVSTQKKKKMLNDANNQLSDGLEPLPKNLGHLQYLEHLYRHLERLQQQANKSMDENAKMREQLDNREILLRLYRQKQRNKYLLYDQQKIFNSRHA